MGTIFLTVSMGSWPRRVTKQVQFLVVDVRFEYNVILGRPALNLFRAVVSTYHMKMKFPTSSGVGEVRGDRKEGWKCYTNLAKRRDFPRQPTQSHPSHDDLPSRKRWRGASEILVIHAVFQGTHEAYPPPAPTPAKRKLEQEGTLSANDLLHEIELEPHIKGRTTRIGTELSAKLEMDLTAFLRKNKDVFAWSTDDLKGIEIGRAHV